MIKTELEEYLDKNPKKYLIFDLDLTLVELVLPWGEIVSTIDKEFQKLDKEIAKRCLDWSWTWQGYNEMVKKYGGKKIKDMIDSRYKKFETERLIEMKPNQPLIDFIKNNKNKYFFYIWSNNQRPTVEKFVKDFGLTSFFKVLVSASDTKFYKPDKGGFDRIYEVGTDKHEYLMIGDGAGDRQAAMNVGIDYFYTSFNLT